MASAVTRARSNLGGGAERFSGELVAFHPIGASTPALHMGSPLSGVLNTEVSDSSMPESLRDPTEPAAPVAAFSRAIGEPLFAARGDGARGQLVNQYAGADLVVGPLQGALELLTQVDRAVIDHHRAD